MNIDRSILVDAVAKLIKAGSLNVDGATVSKSSSRAKRRDICQTHAEVTNAGLGESVKHTMTARILDIPLGETRLFETPTQFTDKEYRLRITGIYRHIKSYGSRLGVKTVKGGVMVTRRAA